MRKKIIFLILFGFLQVTLVAQVGTGEKPVGISHLNEERALPIYSFKFDGHQKSDTSLLAGKQPLLLGFSVPVNLKFSEFATREISSGNNHLIWRMHLSISGAKELGVVFENLNIREHDKLFIYDESETYTLGAFTASANTVHGYFSAQPLPSSDIIIEYQSFIHDTPPDFIIEELVLIQNESSKNSNTSGPCNVNINCPEGERWQKQKRGVARVLLRSGNRWYSCSGSLVNNTAQDGTPYFLLADHCGPNASNNDYKVWQFFFNDEYSNCEGSGTRPTDYSLTGSTLLASASVSGGSDFKLLLLESDIPNVWSPYYNGWNRSSIAAESGVCIHHPRADAKKISTYEKTLQVTTYPGGLSNGYWLVNWAPTFSGYGVTEEGSSGSPIFDQNGLITGTLTGGSASCTSPHLPDYYGRFDKHWRGNGNSADKSLQPWLDPLNSNTQILYGFDPNTVTSLIKVEVVPEEAGQVTGVGYFAEDEEISLIAEPAEGYVFAGWIDSLGDSISTKPRLEFIMPSREVKIGAHFSELETSANIAASKTQFQIFPVPAAEYIWVETGIHSETYIISIFNSMGQLMITEQIYPDSSPHKVALTHLPQGIYFLRASQHNTSILRRFIIKR